MINIYMTSTLIEARARDSAQNSSATNASYLTTLKNSVTIETGDTLTLRNCFIDSAEQSTTIQVDSPTTLTIEYTPVCRLTTDLKVKTEEPVVIPTANPSVQQVLCKGIFYDKDATPDVWQQTTALLRDGADTQGVQEGWGNAVSYVPTVSGQMPAGMEQVASITVYPISNVGPQGVLLWGDTVITFYYQGPLGPLKYEFEVPLQRAAGGRPFYTKTFATGTGPIFAATAGFSWYPGVGLVPPTSNNLELVKGAKIKFDGTNSQNDNYGIPITEQPIPPVAGSIHYSPVLLNATIQIETGEYAPAILANIISRKLNATVGTYLQNGTVPPSTVTIGDPYYQYSGTQGSFLKQGSTLLRPISDGATIQPGASPYITLCSLDNSASIVQLYVKDEIAGLLGGCANFELDFDNQTQTFKIPKLHTEYYYNAAQPGQAVKNPVEGVKIQQISGLRGNTPLTAPDDWKTSEDKQASWTAYNTDRASMLITNMTSVRQDAQPSDFWSDELGFDTKSIIVSSHSRTVAANSYLQIGDLTNKLTDQSSVPVYDFSGAEMGRKRTAPYLTASVIYPELQQVANYVLAYGPGNAGYGEPVVVPPAADNRPDGYLGIATTDTLSIFGRKTLADILTKDGFFRIIINGIPAARLHDHSSVQLISAVVSKYYSGSSYTNGFSSDSITYVHQGAPLQISTLNVQIQNSDGTLADVGVDNTIFIELIKATPTGLT